MGDRLLLEACSSHCLLGAFNADGVALALNDAARPFFMYNDGGSSITGSVDGEALGHASLASLFRYEPEALHALQEAIAYGETAFSAVLRVPQPPSPPPSPQQRQHSPGAHEGAAQRPYPGPVASAGPFTATTSAAHADDGIPPTPFQNPDLLAFDISAADTPIDPHRHPQPRPHQSPSRKPHQTPHDTDSSGQDQPARNSSGSGSQPASPLVSALSETDHLLAALDANRIGIGLGVDPTDECDEERENDELGTDQSDAPRVPSFGSRNPSVTAPGRLGTSPAQRGSLRQIGSGAYGLSTATEEAGAEQDGGGEMELLPPLQRRQQEGTRPPRLAALAVPQPDASDDAAPHERRFDAGRSHSSDLLLSNMPPAFYSASGHQGRRSTQGHPNGHNEHSNRNHLTSHHLPGRNGAPLGADAAVAVPRAYRHRHSICNAEGAAVSACAHSSPGRPQRPRRSTLRDRLNRMLSSLDLGGKASKGAGASGQKDGRLERGASAAELPTAFRISDLGRGGSGSGVGVGGGGGAARWHSGYLQSPNGAFRQPASMDNCFMGRSDSSASSAYGTSPAAALAPPPPAFTAAAPVPTTAIAASAVAAQASRSDAATPVPTTAVGLQTVESATRASFGAGAGTGAEPHLGSAPFPEAAAAPAFRAATAGPSGFSTFSGGGGGGGGGGLVSHGSVGGLGPRASVQAGSPGLQRYGSEGLPTRGSFRSASASLRTVESGWGGEGGGWPALHSLAEEAPPCVWLQVNITIRRGAVSPAAGGAHRGTGDGSGGDGLVLLLNASDVSSWMESQQRMEGLLQEEHKLLEAMFPRHVLEHVVRNAVSASTSLASELTMPPPPPGVPSPAAPGLLRASPSSLPLPGVASSPHPSSSGALHSAASSLSSNPSWPLQRRAGGAAGGGEIGSRRGARGSGGGRLGSAGGSGPVRMGPAVAGQYARFMGGGGGSGYGAAGGPAAPLPLATAHRHVTVLFADIVGFTTMCNCLEPIEVMAFLNGLFTRFDTLCDIYGVYKVETIGDCFMAVGGLITVDEEGFKAVRRDGSEDELHAVKVMSFAKALQREVAALRMPHNGQPLRLRVGLHSGPVTAGIVGAKMPRFCLFGDTVNTASRMESTCEPGAVHASGATAALLREEAWSPTGGVQVKGKGEMQTYLWRPKPQPAAEGGGAGNPTIAACCTLRRNAPLTLRAAAEGADSDQPPPQPDSPHAATSGTAPGAAAAAAAASASAELGELAALAATVSAPLPRGVALAALAAMGRGTP